MSRDLTDEERLKFWYESSEEENEFMIESDYESNSEQSDQPNDVNDDGAGGTRTGTLASDLGRLLSSGQAADVTIIVDGQWLPAHRAVLAARSPVFAAIFRNKVLEATGGSYNIKGINQEVLGQLLRFIYTHEAPLLECVAVELLAAADKYCIARLKQQCEHRVIVDLCVENAAYSAVLAFGHMCPRLKAAAIKFISLHYKEVMLTEGWKNALRHHTEASVEICRLLGDSEALETESESETAAFMEDAKGSLAGDLVALLESGEGSDVTLLVGQVPVAAHRAVLVARSPVLAQQLRDAPDGVLRVDGAQEEQVRQALLYMYGDRTPPPVGVTDRLLALADQYALHGLKEYCGEHLAGEINVDNAVSLAIVATKHSCCTLKDACIDFIEKNIFEVMDTYGWDMAVHEDPAVVVEISKRVAAARRS